METSTIVEDARNSDRTWLLWVIAVVLFLGNFLGLVVIGMLFVGVIAGTAQVFGYNLFTRFEEGMLFPMVVGAFTAPFGLPLGYIFARKKFPGSSAARQTAAAVLSYVSFGIMGAAIATALLFIG